MRETRRCYECGRRFQVGAHGLSVVTCASCLGLSPADCAMRSRVAYQARKTRLIDAAVAAFDSKVQS